MVAKAPFSFFLAESWLILPIKLPINFSKDLNSSERMKW